MEGREGNEIRFGDKVFFFNFGLWSLWDPFLLTWRCISGWFDIFNVFFVCISCFFVYQPTNGFMSFESLTMRENI